jgi:hypothetical protein
LFDIIVVNKVAHELAKVAFNQKNLVFWVDTRGAEGEEIESNSGLKLIFKHKNWH